MPIPREGKFFFEFLIKNSGNSDKIGVGACANDDYKFDMPGWTPLSIGYYGVDGIVYVEKTIHHTNTVCVSIIQTNRS